MKTVTFTFALVIMLAVPASAQVVKYVDAQGVTHYVQSVDQIPEQYRGKVQTPTTLPPVTQVEQAPLSVELQQQLQEEQQLQQRQQQLQEQQRPQQQPQQQQEQQKKSQAGERWGLYRMTPGGSWRLGETYDSEAACDSSARVERTRIYARCGQMQ